ncbi:MAG: hypothetical protein AAF957_06600 [Planctomycetota bacterium]
MLLARLPFAAAVLVAPALASQGGVDVEARGLVAAARTAEHALQWDVDRHGAHWVRGRDFKASADSSGFTFVPFLGSDAPRNMPVAFRLHGVSRGTHELGLEASADVRRSGDRLVLDRGAVEVRYDVTLGAVEQSFELDVPAGEGDLVLRLAVDSDLAQRTVDGTTRFEGDRGGVTYGAAVAIASDGRRSAVQKRAWDGGLELVVPAAFLDTLAGSLVVDPVIASYLLDDFEADLFRPDAAYDALSDRYCVVYEEVFSGNDTDLFSFYFQPATGVVTDDAYVDMTAESWREPSIASVDNARQFRVVAGIDGPGGFSVDIGSRTRSAVDGSLGVQFILKGASSGYTCSNARIGGDAAMSIASFYGVVYERNYGGFQSDVAMIIVDPDDNYVGPELVLADDPTRNEWLPAISKSTGNWQSANEWIVAWRHDDAANGVTKVVAQQIDYAGTPLTPTFDVHTETVPSGMSQIEVSCPSDVTFDGTLDRLFLVTYTLFDGAGVDVEAALCVNSTTLSRTTIHRAEHASGDLERNGPCVLSLTDGWIVAMREFGAPLSTTRTHFTTLHPVGDRLGISERRTAVSGPGDNVYQLGGASALSGGAAAARRDALLVWCADRGSDVDLYGAVVSNDDGTQACGAQYCYGFPNSTGDRGFLRAVGDRSIGTQKVLAASALPTHATGMYLASLTQGYAAFPGGSQGAICLGGTIGRFGIFNSGSGGENGTLLDPQAIAQPVGTVAAMSGETWSFQCWHRDAVGGAATSNFTNAVEIPFQ